MEEAENLEPEEGYVPLGRREGKEGEMEEPSVNKREAERGQKRVRRSTSARRRGC